MWFDLALRLAYPDTPVAGEFFYDDGSEPEGNCFKLVADRCQWDGTGVESLVKETSVKHVAVLEFQPRGPIRIVPKLPAFLSTNEEAASIYSPQTVLADAPPSPIAVRRYGPIPPR